MFPVSESNIFSEKILDFGVTAAIKQQQRLTNPTMVCYYRYSCLDLPVVLVGLQVEGCLLSLYNVYQGGYVAMNEIHFDGVGWKICRDFVDKILGRGKSETLKKVGDSTVYGTDESEEGEEEVEGTVLGGGGD